MKDKLVDEILIPILRGLVIGIPLGFAVGLIKTLQWGIFIGIVAWAIVTLMEYNSRIPKKYQGTKFYQTKNSQVNTNNATVDTYRVEAWVDIPGEWGSALSSPVKPDVLERIGFHLTMLDGRLSHPYLVWEWKILTRPQLEDLQKALAKAEWGEYSGTKNKGGLKLNEKGNLFFKGAGMKYRTLTKEEKRRFEYVFTSPTPPQRLLLAKWIRFEGDVANKQRANKDTNIEISMENDINDLQNPS